MFCTKSYIVVNLLWCLLSRELICPIARSRVCLVPNKHYLWYILHYCCRNSWSPSRTARVDFGEWKENSWNNRSPDPLESTHNLNYKHRSRNVKYPFEKSSNVLSSQSWPKVSRKIEKINNTRQINLSFIVYSVVKDSLYQFTASIKSLFIFVLKLNN